jgi:TetR/AcrR family transcriptional regulator, transcriptional repressor for nem operon
MVENAKAQESLTLKGRATRSRIVSAAADLVYEQGVARTSMQDVQQAAHVSGSQLSHYFGDKASLVHAVVELRSGLLFDRQGPWLSRVGSLKGIREWRDYVVSYARRRDGRGGCPLGSLVSELADLDPIARSDLAETFRNLTSMFLSGLEEMQRRGELADSANPRQLATALVAAMEGGLLLAKVDQDVAALEAGLDTVIDRISSLTSSQGDRKPSRS